MSLKPRSELNEALRSSAALALLSAVWDNAPVARSALGRLTGLAPSSVTRVANRLADAGLIEERHTAKSTGGRPAMLLSLSDIVGAVVAIDLGGVAIRGAILTPNGHHLAARERSFAGAGEEDFLVQVEALVEDLFADAAAARLSVLAIGVSVPGTVDKATGTVVDVTHLGLRDVALGPRLENRFGLPTWLEHDTAAAAYAEKRSGAGRGREHLVFLTISSGIGAGLVLDDRIYRGEAGAAGELGHVVVEIDGPVCVCGKRGCLEAVASAPSLLAAARELLDGCSSPGIAAHVHAAGDVLSIDAVVAAAVAGDTAASALLDREAEYLARAIGTVTSLLDIRTVIIGGEEALLGDVVLDRIRRALPRYQLYSNQINVVRAQLGQDAALRGAAAMAFRRAFGLTDLNGHNHLAAPQLG